MARGRARPDVGQTVGLCRLSRGRRTGLHPKNETRKLRTLVLKWEVNEVKKRQKQKRKTNRAYTLEYKVAAVERMLGGENIKALSRILGVARSQLYRWLDRYREQGVERLRGPGRPPSEAAVRIIETPAETAARRIAELERKVGQQTLEVDFLRRAFKRVKESRQPKTRPGERASTGRSGQ